MKFITPDLSDRRIIYAAKRLQSYGYEQIQKTENADFILLGVNPDKKYLNTGLLTFAGNTGNDKQKQIIDYVKSESFAEYNAFLTAEAAVSLAVTLHVISLINANVLICGYGRIGKALHRYLSVYTNSITICTRNPLQQTDATIQGATVFSTDDLAAHVDQDFIFNTVPHPLFDYRALSVINKDARLIDLASFPGGVDLHAAKVLGINVTVAGGLPAKYAPASAGYAVADTVASLLKEVIS